MSGGHRGRGNPIVMPLLKVFFFVLVEAIKIMLELLKMAARLTAWLLTTLVFPALRAGAEGLVVLASSLAHRRQRHRRDDEDFDDFDDWAAA